MSGSSDIEFLAFSPWLLHNRAMKRVVEADPEVALFLLFDESLVKDEFKAANAGGTQSETLERLHDEGKAVLVGDEDLSRCSPARVHL